MAGHLDSISIVVAYSDQEVILKKAFPRDKLLRYSDLAYQQLRGTTKSTFRIEAKQNQGPDPKHYFMLLELIENVDDGRPDLNADFSTLLRLYAAGLTIRLDKEVGQHFVLDPIYRRMTSVVLTSEDITFAWRALSNAHQDWTPASGFREPLLDDILRELIHCLGYGVHDYIPGLDVEWGHMNAVIENEPGLESRFKKILEETSTFDGGSNRPSPESANSSPTKSRSEATGGGDTHSQSGTQSVHATGFNSRHWSTEALAAWSKETFEANPKRLYSSTRSIHRRSQSSPPQTNITASNKELLPIETDASKAGLQYRPLIYLSESDQWSTMAIGSALTEEPRSEDEGSSG